MPGSWPHLTRRFLSSLRPLPLTETEEATIRQWLPGGLDALFFAQSVGDQRHGLESLTAIGIVSSSPSHLRAALLHDVGKRHARLATLGRTISTILIKLRLKLPIRSVIYRDHGIHGAADIRRLEEDPLVIQFAHHHHGPRPDSIPESSWAELCEADEPPRTLWRRSSN